MDFPRQGTCRQSSALSEQATYQIFRVYMKRIILFCAVFFASVALHAQVYKYNATSLSIKTYNETYDYWSDWSDWEPCKVLVVINTEQDKITIYSDVVQEYDVYDWEDLGTDADNGTSSAFSCVDADGLRCTVRIREQSDGVLQLYVDYADMMWVYNIEAR